MAALLLRRHWSAIPRVFRWMLVLFAAGAAFVAIEEISYGQTFWEYHTPAWFLEANHQREFNLHNLAGDAPSRLLRRVGEFGLPIFGLVLPLLWMRRGRGDARGRSGSTARARACRSRGGLGAHPRDLVVAQGP